MSRLYKYLTATVAALLCCSSLDAQTDFFWSFQDLNSGAVNGSASGNFAVGDTGSIFLYYSTNGPIDSDLSFGAFLDLMTTQNGVVAITDAETFDYEIHVGSSPIGNRWLNPLVNGGNAGRTGEISDDG